MDLTSNTQPLDIKRPLQNSHWFSLLTPSQMNKSHCSRCVAPVWPNPLLLLVHLHPCKLFIRSKAEPKQPLPRYPVAQARLEHLHSLSPSESSFKLKIDDDIVFTSSHCAAEIRAYIYKLTLLPGYFPRLSSFSVFLLAL